MFALLSTPPESRWLLSGAILVGTLFAVLPSTAETHGLKEYLSQHCFRCHGEKKAKGGLDLAKLISQQPLIKNREQWNHVIDLITASDMPPEDETQPKPEERKAILHLLNQELNHFDFSKIDDPGFENARRLTNQEYNNTLSDLFGMPLSPADRFPADLTGASGFENSANTLFLQPALMERYIAAAERVTDAVLPTHTKPVKRTAAFQRIFTILPSESVDTDTAARQVLGQFLLRAYRRPPTEAELIRAMKHFRESLAASPGAPGFVGAVKQVIQAALISPKFLLRIEQGQETADPYRITDFELASRLSYFLWATMPDDELFALAAESKLHKPDVLPKQIDRMLQSPKAQTLGSVFAAQWLGFRFIGNRIRLDPIDNPWCTDTLMAAMRQESGLFFTSLIQENRPIDDLVTAKYSFLNEELAKVIYGMNTVKGSELRKVSLTDPNRSGILTHGSLMAVTSNYKETSPIKRGNWILETFLGRPLPPPPPNAGAFKEEVEDDDSLTFREKVELHSSDPSCRSCHDKIDPLGFSLENFDYFGRWRDNYRVRVIERNDEEALKLVMAVRKVSKEELHDRIESLNSGPEARKQIREQLAPLHQMSEEDLQKEIRTNLSTSKQNRLIRLLDRLKFGDEEESVDLHEGILALRSLPQAQIDSRLEEWDGEDAERNEALQVVHWLRNLSEEQIEDMLDDIEIDDHEDLFGILELFGVFEEGEDVANSDEDLLALIQALRELDEDELIERIDDLEPDAEERREIFERTTFFKNLPENDLPNFITTHLDKETRFEVTAILLEMDFLEEEEDDDDRWQRPRFASKPIAANATLPDGTPFKGPIGLRKVLLDKHRDDLTRQLTTKMLSYALGRQFEYYDEPAIRSITQELAQNDSKLQSLVKGIAMSYPFQYKKNPSTKPK